MRGLLAASTHDWGLLVKRVKIILHAGLFVTVIFLLIIATISLLTLFTYNNRRIQKAMPASDICRLQTIHSVIYDINNETGVRILSIESFQNTAYYPFIESYNIPWVTDLYMIQLSKSEQGTMEYSGVVIYKGHEMVLHYHDHISTNQEYVTNKLIKAYLSGTHYWLALIDKERQIFIKGHNDAVSMYHSLVGRLPENKYSLTPNRVPIIASINIDHYLPTYINWLKKINNLSSLTDGWGNNLHFYTKNNRVFCVSNGKDELYNTDDDIILSVPVTTLLPRQ